MTTDVSVILGDVLTTVRGVRISRLEVTHPADDDNLWFIQQGVEGPEVQVEASADGALPVILEGEGIEQVARPATREDAVQLIREWLQGPS